MVSNYEKSKTIYENVINLYPNTEAGILSWKLLEFIQSMNKERGNVAKSNISGIEKAKQYYLLMDFKNAISQYSKLVNQTESISESAEVHFFKGRSHEELGETEDAILEYNIVAKMNTKENWSRQANRRLLMLGEFYERQKSISDEAKKQLEKYQDQQFIKNMELYSSLVPQASLKSELSSNKRSVDSKANDSILQLIDNIGSIDLEGKDQERKEKIVAATALKSESATLSPAEYKELERKQLLNQNPYRRPAYLKEVIDNNSQQLRYLYNKRLRMGIKLSGRILVEMSIDPNGAIGNLQIVQSNIGDQSFESEVIDRIRTWTFNPIPDSLGALTVNYPFEFDEEQ
jgi:TonB family protein